MKNSGCKRRDFSAKLGAGSDLRLIAACVAERERTGQRDHHRGSGTVTKMSPKISERTGKDGKYRKGWKGELPGKIKEFSRNAGRRPT